MVNTAESDTSLWFQRLLILIRFLMSTIILDHNQSWQWGMSDSSHLVIADISRILVSSSSSHPGKHEDVLWCAICVPPVSSPWPSQSSPELSLIFLSLYPSPWPLPEYDHDCPCPLPHLIILQWLCCPQQDFSRKSAHVVVTCTDSETGRSLCGS